MQLGHGRLGPGLVVLPGRPAHRRDAVHVRRHRQLRRVLRLDNDSLINQTLASSNLTYMYNWQNYLSPQLPVEWQPNAPYQNTEVVNNLHGVLPQTTTLMLDPGGLVLREVAVSAPIRECRASPVLPDSCPGRPTAAAGTASSARCIRVGRRDDRSAGAARAHRGDRSGADRVDAGDPAG